MLLRKCIIFLKTVIEIDVIYRMTTTKFERYHKKSASPSSLHDSCPRPRLVEKHIVMRNCDAERKKKWEF